MNKQYISSFFLLVVLMTSCGQVATPTEEIVTQQEATTTVENTQTQMNTNVDAGSQIISRLHERFGGSASLSSSFTWTEGRESALREIQVDGQETTIVTPLEDVESYLQDMESFTLAGAIDYDEDEPRMWKYRNYPEVCVLTTPVGSYATVTVQCGILPESFVLHKPYDTQAIDTMVTSLSTTLGSTSIAPKPAYFLWYDREDFNTEYPVLGAEYRILESDMSDVMGEVQQVFTENGFTQTQFVADGPAASMFGVQRGSTGCLIEVVNAQVVEARESTELTDYTDISHRGMTTIIQCAGVL